jgi:hypothetical protein
LSLFLSLLAFLPPVFSLLLPLLAVDASLSANGVARSDQHRRTDDKGESYSLDVFLFHNFSL